MHSWYWIALEPHFPWRNDRHRAATILEVYKPRPPRRPVARCVQWRPLRCSLPVSADKAGKELAVGARHRFAPPKRAFYYQKGASKRLNGAYITASRKQIKALWWSDPNWGVRRSSTPGPICRTAKLCTDNVQLEEAPQVATSRRLCPLALLLNAKSLRYCVEDVSLTQRLRQFLLIEILQVFEIVGAGHEFKQLFLGRVSV